MIYNPFFGSIFRTHITSTFFSRRLFRVADIYTSRITNMNRFGMGAIQETSFRDYHKENMKP